MKKKITKHFSKRKDFSQVLDIEKRFADTFKRSKKDRVVYKNLERELSMDRLKANQPIVSTRYDRSSTIEPNFPNSNQSHTFSNSIISSVSALNDTSVQTHLRKLKFNNGLYQLTASDSLKRFNERPLNEIYNGKLSK